MSRLLEPLTSEDIAGYTAIVPALKQLLLSSGAKRELPTSPVGSGEPAPYPIIFGKPIPFSADIGQPPPYSVTFGNPYQSTAAIPASFGQAAPSPVTFGQPAPSPATFGQPPPSPATFGQPAYVLPSLMDPNLLYRHAIDLQKLGWDHAAQGSVDPLFLTHLQRQASTPAVSNLHPSSGSKPPATDEQVRGIFRIFAINI